VVKEFDALKKLLQPPFLSAKNSERLTRVFYDAAKIVYRKQERLNKPILKVKEVSGALVLAESLHSKMYRFDAVDKLAECFGTFDETAALEYFEKNVMGEVTDKRGRVIIIDEDAMKSLYKERSTGKHVAAVENYEEGRGKRLPWIRHTLVNSDAIYIHEENAGYFRRSYLYIATVSTPLKGAPAKTSYYVVVVRETKNSEFKVITAYAMFKRNEFLKVIEPCFAMA
jgi:phage-Barnase-EndoU-ColicinE5/D-RelE like nuclease2